MPNTTRMVTQAEKRKIIPLNGTAIWSADPDLLRDQVQRALSTICIADRSRLSHVLLNRLEKTRINVGASLLMLGISAASVDQLTPSDMGKLLRYIRINSPAAIEALAEPLNELLALEKEAAFGSQASHEAA